MKLRLPHFLVLSALVIPQANAQVLVPDQQNDPQPITQKDFVGGVSPGQTFIPTLNGIDYAEFIFNNFDGVAGQMSLRLRDGVGGTILDTSDVINVPGDNSFNYYQFTFSSRIALTAGHTYDLEPFQISGGTVWICYRLEDNYANGSAYWGGSQKSYDYNFQEGILEVPEPASSTLLCLAIAGALGAARFRRVG